MSIVLDGTNGITGAFNGNATTATTLQTARTINGVSFDGSANITVVDSTKLPLAGGTVTGTIRAPSVVVNNAGAVSGSLDVTDDLGHRTLFRGGRIDHVDAGNLNWSNGQYMANGFYWYNPSGTSQLKIESGRVWFNTTGSRGYSGYAITNPNDNLANAWRASGYIEWQTDVGAIGTSYFNSDISLKENIAPSTKSASDVINAIDFVAFDWKPDAGNEGHVEVGVIAQQLQTVDSRLVSELSDKKLIVNEPALMAHMAKALQEALTEIKTLTERVKILEA